MRSLLMIPLALAGLCQAAQAGDISSAYTDLDWKKDCVTYAQAQEGEGDWASLALFGLSRLPGADRLRRCPGIAVLWVFPPAT
nr:hypothetical protein [Mesorhizobium ciceri]